MEKGNLEMWSRKDVFFRKVKYSYVSKKIKKF